MSLKDGDHVKIHFTGRLEDGTVFDTSRGREPLEFTIGESEVIPGFEKAVLDLAQGQSTAFSLPAAEGYGPRDEELMMQVERNLFPDDIVPEVGMELELTPPEGDPVHVTVAEIAESKVMLDANHPLAGKTLYFDVELLEIG